MSKSTNTANAAKNGSDLPPAVKRPPRSYSALLKTLGSPIRPETSEAQVWHWTAESAPADGGVLHKDGDGVLVVRRARLDPHTCKESVREICAMLDFAERRGLKPREIAFTCQSGGAALDERWDFRRIAGEVRTGNLKWVAYPCFDRVGRDTAVVKQFLELLNKAGVDLYLPRDVSEPCGEHWLKALCLSPIG